MAEFLNEHELTPEELQEMEETNGTTTKLVMNFAKSNGNTMSLSFNYARNDASNADIKSLMEGIIANGSIFQNVPAAMKSAQIVTTETTEVDLS